VAIQLYNQRAGTPQATIYGVVTTGELFLFLRLRDSLVEVDIETYALHPLERILGVLIGIFPDTIQ
jgi:hypothetical protein